MSKEKKKNQPQKNKCFQIKLDSDSLFISQSPDSKKSRVILADLDQRAFEQLAVSIDDAGLTEDMIKQLSAMRSTEQVSRTLYTLYLGLDALPSAETMEKIQKCVGSFTESYTMTEGTGVFRKQQEHTQLIQIAVQNPDLAYRCADALRREFGQKAVGITEGSAYQRVVENPGDAPEEPAIEYPFGAWVEELANLAEVRRGKENSNRMEWILGKLDLLGVAYSNFKPSMHTISGIKQTEYYSQYTVVSFSGKTNDIRVPFVVWTGTVERSSCERFDYATGIVQMLILAKKLKDLDRRENISLIFVDGDDPEISADHLNTSIQQREIGGLVDFLVFPTCFTGDCLTVETPHDTALNSLYELMNKNTIRKSEFDAISCDLVHNSELEYYECLTLGSDHADEDVPGYDPNRPVSKAQIEFAQTDAFLNINALLFDFALEVSKEASDKSNGWPFQSLDTDFLH